MFQVRIRITLIGRYTLHVFSSKTCVEGARLAVVSSPIGTISGANTGRIVRSMLSGPPLGTTADRLVLTTTKTSQQGPLFLLNSYLREGTRRARVTVVAQVVCHLGGQCEPECWAA